MKQFLLRHRKNMLLRAISSASILSLFGYAVLRCLYYEFPMNWAEEIFFFLKTFFTSCFVISTATAGSAWLYRIYRQMKVQK